MAISPFDLIPTQKMERWKYTPISRALKQLSLEPASLGWGRGIEPITMAAPALARYNDSNLWDLNTQQTQDIRLIQGDADILIDAGDRQWISPRLVITVPDNTTLTIIERLGGQGGFWNNMVVQVTVGRNVALRHYRHINLPETGVLSAFTHVKIAADARYHAFSLVEGGGTIRNQIHAEVMGQNALCDLAGVSLLSGKQHADTTITIEHQAPHCQSNQLYKTVLVGQSRGVFQGKVHVHKAAQKTDGYQLSNALILSDGAEMDTKPELEIYADDVKCSHGATTGKLDDVPLFYLQSRGIPLALAKRLLIESFCAEAVKKVENEIEAKVFSDRVNAWLSQTI